MNTETIHRDLGRVEGEVKALRRDVDDINKKLDAVLARQYRFAGAVSVATAIVSFGIAWILK